MAVKDNNGVVLPDRYYCHGINLKEFWLIGVKRHERDRLRIRQCISNGLLQEEVEDK
jgi:hypothetical protein